MGTPAMHTEQQEQVEVACLDAHCGLRITAGPPTDVPATASCQSGPRRSPRHRSSTERTELQTMLRWVSLLACTLCSIGFVASCYLVPPGVRLLPRDDAKHVSRAMPRKLDACRTLPHGALHPIALAGVPPHDICDFILIHCFCGHLAFVGAPPHALTLGATVRPGTGACVALRRLLATSRRDCGLWVYTRILALTLLPQW